MSMVYGECDQVFAACMACTASAQQRSVSTLLADRCFIDTFQCTFQCTIWRLSFPLLGLCLHDNSAPLSCLDVSEMFLACLHERSGCDYEGLHNSKMAAQYLHTAVNSLNWHIVNVRFVFGPRMSYGEVPVLLDRWWNWTFAQHYCRVQNRENRQWYQLGVCPKQIWRH